MRLSPRHARSRRCQLKPRLRAVERVLFGGWGRTHTRSAGRPSSPVSIQRRCLHATPSERRRVAQEATPRGEQRAPCRSSLRGWTPRRHPGWLPALRFVSGEPHALAARGLRFQLHRARGRAPAPEQGLDKPGSSGAAATRWGGCAFASTPAPAGDARRPSAAAPSQPIPPPFNVRGRVALGRQRRLPGTSASTAHGER